MIILFESRTDRTLRVNRPTEWVIRNCLARRGAGLVTPVKPPVASGIFSLLTSKASHTDNGLRLKSATTRGGVIEDIYFQTAISIPSKRFQYNLNWYPALQLFHPPGRIYRVNDTAALEDTPAKLLLKKALFARGFYIRDQGQPCRQCIQAASLPGSWLTRFVYTDCRISATLPGTLGINPRLAVQPLQLQC